MNNLFAAHWQFIDHRLSKALRRNLRCFSYAKIFCYIKKYNDGILHKEILDIMKKIFKNTKYDL
jgi:hypothetical protein